MAVEVGNNPASAHRSVSNGAMKASKFKSAEFIEDSDDEEPVETSNREGAKYTPSDSSKISVPVESVKKRNKSAKGQDFSNSPKPSPSPLVQNGRLPKKPKLDMSSSFHKAKASVDVEPVLTHNSTLQSANFSSSPGKRLLEVNGRPSKKRKLDISSSSSSDSQESDIQSDGEEGNGGSHSDASSDTGASDASRSGRHRSTERSNKSQSETSISTGTSNEGGGLLPVKNSAPITQMSIPRGKAASYEPPPGFKSASITLHPASEIEQITSSSALQGKELWHVTVPNSVPISSINEMSTKSIFTGAAILSHDGAEYSLSLEIQNKTAKTIVLFPSSRTTNYESAGINVARTLRLERVVRLPNSASASDKPTEDASLKSTKKKIEQPPGLKMRYRPFGASSESSEKSDSEPTAKELPSTTHFQIPRNIINSSSSKRKRDQADQSDEAQSPAKVKRKTKPASSDVLPEAHETAQSKADSQHSAINSDNEPTDTPRPQSLSKTKTNHRHQRKEIGRSAHLPKFKLPIKPTTSPHQNSIDVSSKQTPTEPPKSSPTKPSKNLPPSPQTIISHDTKLSFNGESLSSEKSPIKPPKSPPTKPSPNPPSSPQNTISRNTKLSPNEESLSSRKSSRKPPKSSPTKPSQNLPPSPQTATSQNSNPPPNSESQQPFTPIHETETQQHAGKLDLQSEQPVKKHEQEHEVSSILPQIPNPTPTPSLKSHSAPKSKSKSSSKRTETPNEKALRRAEPRENETLDDKALRTAELEKNETPDDKALRKALRKARKAELKEHETPDEKALRKGKAEVKKNETPDENAPRKTELKKDETPDEKVLRKAEFKKNESPDEKALRKAELKKNETPDEKALRKARKAEPKKNETPHEKAVVNVELKNNEILDEKALRKAELKKNETPDEKSPHKVELKKDETADEKALRIAEPKKSETPDEKALRKARKAGLQKTETPKERNMRILELRERKERRRSKKEGEK